MPAAARPNRPAPVPAGEARRPPARTRTPSRREPDRAEMSEPCCRTISRQIASPRPVPLPGGARLVGGVEPLEDVRQVGLGDRLAVVAHETGSRACPRAASRRSARRLPTGRNFSALSTRLETTWLTRLASPSAKQRSPSNRTSTETRLRLDALLKVDEHRAGTSRWRRTARCPAGTCPTRTATCPAGRGPGRSAGSSRPARRADTAVHGPRCGMVPSSMAST